MDRKIVTLDSIDTFSKLYGFPTRHPLVTVVDYKTAKYHLDHATITYGLYALFLKNGTNCSIRYGRRSYDYQEGSVVSFAPGQTVEVDNDPAQTTHDVIGLLFHPDLMYGTPLADKIKSFSFFDYAEMESLHLSDTEKMRFMQCIEQIKLEIEHPVDHHSAALLAGSIQVLVEYLHRFYDRQFITRHKVNSEIMSLFQRHLKDYFNGEQIRNGLPNVAYFAQKANLSAGYFSDLVRKETGLSPKDIISGHVVSEAKHRLAAGRLDISGIAYELGFEYPAHFTRMFKRVTGQSPTQYRSELETYN